MMEDPKKWGFIFALILVTLIFSVAAVFTPWWKVTTTRENEIMRLNISAPVIAMRAEYGLFRTVSATRITKVENETLSISMPFANLTGNDADKNALSSMFNNALTLTMVGSALTALTAVMVLVSGLHRPLLFKYAKFGGIIAALLLATASIYLMVEMPPVVSKLTSVIPTDIYELAGSNIKGFWGGIDMETTTGFQEWIWEPAFGWYLAFTAFLLNAATSMLIHTIYGKTRN